MRADDSSPEFSIIITCFFEEQSIDEFHARLSAALETLQRSYEIILVNDGSTDSTLAKLDAIFERDPRVTTVIDLFKNAGQAAAITAGATHARGRAFIFIDSDLQLDPEELPSLVAEYDKGFDVVSGYRRNRQDSLLRRVPSRLANAAMRRVSNADLRDFGCTFWIIDGRLVRAFEIGPFQPIRLPYLIAGAGRCSEVPITHHARRYGRSGWTFAKLLTYYLDSLVAVSPRPFQWLSGVLLLLGACFVLRLVVNFFRPFFFFAAVTNGLLLNAIVLSFLIGVAVSAALGEYVVRSYFMLLRHPAYVIRRVRSRSHGVASVDSCVQ